MAVGAPHPRLFKVTRHQPGLDWAPHTHTYHPSLKTAERAAVAYLRGEGRYDAFNWDPAKRYAVISQRTGAEPKGASRGTIRYAEVKVFTPRDLP